MHNKKDLNKSNRAKFIELLLWYSKIKNIIDNIRTNNRKKGEKFQYILQLQDYKEMKNAIKLIVSTDELTENEFNMIYSILNSHYIIKMIQSNLVKYLYNTIFEINKILDDNLSLTNNNYINQDDYFYIHEFLKEVDNNFLVCIPKFSSKDIISLYILLDSKQKNKSDYEQFECSIIKPISYGRMLEVLVEQKKILNDNFGRKLTIGSAKEIIYTLSKNRFEIKECFEEFSKDIENKILNLKDNNDKQKSKNFIDIFKITLDIAKKIDDINKNKQNIKLLFDDTIFLKYQK